MNQTEDLHTNFAIFSTNFSTEEVCLKYLSDLRWNNNPFCPHCNNPKVYEYKDGKLYKCAKCRKQFSAKVGTVFEGSKIPLTKWFITIYRITTNEYATSSLQLCRDISVTQKTAWYMLDRIRATFRIKSTSGKAGNRRKNIQEPMMKRINKPFDEVLKELLKVESKKIHKLELQIENKVSLADTPSPNVPSREFNPEID
jgi:transposase-like protein